MKTYSTRRVLSVIINSKQVSHMEFAAHINSYRPHDFNEFSFIKTYRTNHLY